MRAAVSGKHTGRGLGFRQSQWYKLRHKQWRPQLGLALLLAGMSSYASVAHADELSSLITTLETQKQSAAADSALAQSRGIYQKTEHNIRILPSASTRASAPSSASATYQNTATANTASSTATPNNQQVRPNNQQVSQQASPALRTEPVIQIPAQVQATETSSVRAASAYQAQRPAQTSGQHRVYTQAQPYVRSHDPMAAKITELMASGAGASRSGGIQWGAMPAYVSRSYSNIDDAYLPIVASAESSSFGYAKTVLQQARQMTLDNREVVVGSCWDYLNAVFNRAGAARHTVHKGTYASGPYAAAETLQPGDWLYYINHGYNDVEHSGLFIGWVDRTQKQALMLSYAGESRQEPARYKVYDLSHVYNIIRAG